MAQNSDMIKKTRPADFEKRCGACKHFGNEKDCPYHRFVCDDTEWTQMHCDKFWD